ncbi:hypothetical protein CK203_098267 [Vitis vinifera]|uniref:Uncharacterized protein n=1 Tax=Vitis vinifera TaxID=29760 RepID=A0A438DHL9_VITVI|nr:hypothetical protein CK203_098267 [Vitis vinifera]
MVNCGSGLAAPSSGPSYGPSALSCGEAQDFGLVSRVALSRDPRPSPLSLREGVSGEAYGPIQVGDLEDGAFYGNETPISLPRARFLQSPPVSRGASQDARGEADPLVGLPRDSRLPGTSISVLFLWGGRDLSSPSPSSFGRVTLNEGSIDVSVSEVNEEEQTPLSIILVDGSNGVLASKGEKPVAEEGLGGEFEGMLQDLDGCRWDDSYLARFSKFLGFSTDGFEGEILNLLLRTKRRREQNLKKGTSGPLSLIGN